MKKILIIFGILLLAAILVIGGLFLFKGSELLQFGAEYGLKQIKSQVKEIAPEGLQADSLMLAFDQALEKTQSGRINTGELKNLLLWIPAKMADGKLDSLEIQNILQRLNKIVKEEPITR